MKRHWFLKGLKFAFFAVLFLTVATFVVMRLWNWLVPAVFGWHLINFWQALGILVLSKILFGGFHRVASLGINQQLPDRRAAGTGEQAQLPLTNR